MGFFVLEGAGGGVAHNYKVGPYIFLNGVI